MSKLRELAQLGQSIWYDYLRRSFITSGDFETLVAEGLRGVTSNLSIFEKTIRGSVDYDPEIQRLARAGKAVDKIYEIVVLEDIARAADGMRQLYDASHGEEGYVSLEVNPSRTNDTAGTIREARRLFAALGRPNVMMKVPATPSGIPAIESLTGDGINLHVTLIFSLDQYDAVARSFIAGLETRAAGGGALAGKTQKPSGVY